MKRLHCSQGHVVFFDNHRCGQCQRELAFDPGRLEMVSESEPGAGLASCCNRSSAIRCNWLAEPGEASGLCVACRSSTVIPTLSKPENLERWRKLESAKRRLVYDLLSLGLPADSTHLRFAFKEDRRTNPDVYEEHVSIGHSKGEITINAAEADDVYRAQMRVYMNEPYRTLLGHFRHEAGHYYFEMLLKDKSEARQLFGDESVAYDEALRNYYNQGPKAGWTNSFISAYASAHPAEDWAECFAHYLHMRAVMETACANGFIEQTDDGIWQVSFIDFVVSLNEVMRSLGLPDAYPFVITPDVAGKIDFVRRAIDRFTGRPAELWSAAD